MVEMEKKADEVRLAESNIRDFEKGSATDHKRHLESELDSLTQNLNAVKNQ
jgi:hypothetical protein